MAAIAPAPGESPSRESAQSGNVTIVVEDDDAQYHDLVPGLCTGSGSFCLIALTCCGLFAIAPLVVIIVYISASSSIAILAIALILFTSGVLYVCYSLFPVTTNACTMPPPPPKHGPFHRAWAGQKQAQQYDVKKVYLVVNPFGGGGKAGEVKAKVMPVFEKAGVAVTVMETTHKGHPVEYAKTLNFEGYDALCVIGGDGSIHDVVNGMLKRPDGKLLPVGIIPGGTGNSVMCDLGTWDVVEAAERVVKGEAVWVDVLKVTDKRLLDVYCVNGVFWGLVGDVGVSAERVWLRRVFGALRYDLMAFWGVLKGQSYTAKVTADDVLQPVTSFTTIIINNTQYFGKGLRAAPHAYLDDSLADFCFLPANTLTRGEKLRVFNQLPTGSHHANPSITLQQSSHIHIETGTPTSRHLCNVDGEIYVFTGHLDVLCLHKQYQVFAPTAVAPM